MKHIKLFLFIILFAIACKEKAASKKGTTETSTSGRIHISVDESFQPVIIEQVKVFQSLYPNATIDAEYKPEAECLRDLQKDSTRMIIISRELNREEVKFYREKITYAPQYDDLAKDAIAVIINNNNPDSVYTLKELKDLLAGTSLNNMNVVVDAKSATSTVRFLIDSVLRGTPLTKKITGAKNSEDLINYIASTPNAIGFVGVSWITNPQSKQQEEVLTKVKAALIECKNCDKDVFAKPSQQTIMFKQYPLVRGLYYVLKENWAGIGSTFVNFMTLERGQLIFSRANLVPTKMQFNRRKTNITESD